MAAILYNQGCARNPDRSGSRQDQSANAITPRNYPNLKLQATQLSEATLRGDYATAERLTYPKLIEVMGGSRLFRESITAAMKELEASGVKIESLSVGEPRDFLEADQSIYAIVPTTLKMKVAEGILVGESALIGISDDKGINWTFVDSAGASDKELRKALFPSVAEKLRIPERKRPVLQKEPT